MLKEGLTTQEAGKVIRGVSVGLDWRGWGMLRRTVGADSWVPSVVDGSAVGDRNATSGGSNRTRSLHKRAEGHQRGHACHNPRACSPKHALCSARRSRIYPWHQTQNALTQCHQGVTHYTPTVWPAQLCESCGRELRWARDADIATDTFHVLWQDRKVAVGLMWEFI